MSGGTAEDLGKATRTVWKRDGSGNTATVDGLFTPYIYPQENGNRSDVRWISLADGAGMGLLAVGEPALNFSASRYTDQDVEARRMPAILFRAVSLR